MILSNFNYMGVRWFMQSIRKVLAIRNSSQNNFRTKYLPSSILDGLLV